MESLKRLSQGRDDSNVSFKYLSLGFLLLLSLILSGFPEWLCWTIFISLGIAFILNFLEGVKFIFRITGRGVFDGTGYY